MSKLLPVGAQTYSKHPSRYAEGVPSVVRYAKGAWVQIYKNGLMHVDLTSGLGAVILGHQHPDVDYAVATQLGRGISFPLPGEHEEKVAERLVSMLTWEKAESVRFGKNGADVTTTAVRLARAVTGRIEVALCDYHGNHDWAMSDPPWNAGVLRHGSERMADYEVFSYISKVEPAAVILEGLSSVTPTPTRDEGFWVALRSLCDDTGTLLILDEMITGFRMAPGGAAEVLGIEPDLACYGKGLANGLPLSAIVGPWEYMQRYEQDVFFSLTHGGEALSLAAANETLRIIQEDNVPEQLAELGREIIALFDAYGASDRLKHGYPQRLVFDFTKAELGIMLGVGVLCAGYANLTLAHVTDKEARSTIMDAFSAVLSA